MKAITVFGASGRTGRHLLRIALSRGYSARAFLRGEPSKISPRPGLSVIQGSLQDRDAVRNAVAGSDCVMIAFGPHAKSPGAFCARATANIVEGMEASGVRRLICVTGAMVGVSSGGRSLAMRWAAECVRRKMPVLMRDREEQERVVMESPLAWTILKPPRLTERRATGRCVTGKDVRVGMLSSIGRADLAEFMLDIAGGAEYERERVFIKSCLGARKR